MTSRALLTAFLLAATAVVTIPGALNAAEPVALDSFGTTCLDDTLKACVVQSAGYLNTREGAPRIAFQLQNGSNEYDGIAAQVVLLVPEDDAWTVLASDSQGVFYSAPLLIEDTLLHVPGSQDGTASNNADLLFQWNADDATWHSIDLTAWQEGIATSLPKGLAIWKGVTYDFTNPWYGLVARTALWQDSDANCCATGGSAEIAFTIVDDVLVAGDVTYTPPAKTKP